jgi:hypothetical protein
MEKNQKELLERVLLLMKYDNKETLSENISKVKILTEQPDPNKVPKNQVYKDAITNCKMQPRNYTWSGFAPRNKESVDKFCNSLQLNYPSFYSKTPSTTNLNPQTAPKPQVLTKETLRKYSIEQLINLYVSNTGKGESRVSAGTSKDNIITVFAEKVSQLSLEELKNLINKNPKVFKSTLSFKDNTVSSPTTTKDFKYNVDKYGPLILLVDYQVWEKKMEQYNKNPKSSNYQPPIQPNWKDLIDKFKLSSLIQYQYSPTQFVTKQQQEQKGLKGYTEKGYPTYSKDTDSLTGGYLNIQWSLVELGVLNEKDISKTHSFGVDYKWYKSLKEYLKSGNYEFGDFLGLTNDNPKREELINNYICMLKDNGQVCKGSKIDLREMPIYSSMKDGLGASQIILSFLRANAYPNIPPDDVVYEEGNKPKEQKEKFEEGVKNAKFLKISIYDVDGKVIPIYSRGDDPDLPTYSLESEGFEFPPQTINLGPIFSILDDNQVKTLVDWLVEYCTEPIDVNGSKGRRIVTKGGSGLNFDDDLISKFPNFMKEMLENESSYPNCVVDFANKETNGDVGKWMIKFLKLPEDQIDLLLQFYPEDYDLIQTYLPGAPGSKDFYINSPLVKNAVKMHIVNNPGSTLGVTSSLYAGTTNTGNYPIEKITDSQIVSVIKQMIKECPNMNKELKDIAAGQREYKGYIVGQFYSSLPSGFINYTIPCADEFWDEYGWAITMGGVLLASLVFPPAFTALGIEMELAILARMSVDVGLNLYSSYRNKLAGNEEASKIDLACAVLSFIVDTPGFEKKFLGGFGDWAEINVLNKVKKARPSNAKKWRQFVSSLSKEEKRHLYDYLNSPRFLRQFKIYGKEALNTYFEKQFGSQWKNTLIKILREVGIKLPIVFSPVMLNFGYKIFIYINQTMEKVLKIPLTETRWKAFEWELKKRGIDTPEEADNFLNSLLKSPEASKNFFEEVLGEEFKGIDTKINVKQLDQNNKEIEKLIREAETKIKS